MSLWTILPVKPFGEGKSRLAGHLSPHRRRTLNRELLAHTLGAVRLAHVKGEVVVVSRDKNALEAAARAGSHALIEQPPDPQLSTNGPQQHAKSTELPLNAALTQATRYAVARGATRILILPTDIPNLTAEDVRAVASPRGAGPQIIIAPSRDGGTNALFPATGPGASFRLWQRKLCAPPAPGRGSGHPRTRCLVRLTAFRHRPARRLRKRSARRLGERLRPARGAVAAGCAAG